MGAFIRGFVIAVAAGSSIIGGVAAWFLLRSLYDGGIMRARVEVRQEKTKEERLADALERSRAIKALYMTADVANDQGRAATRLRDKIVAIAEATEINGLVIDVKEVCGPDYDGARLKNLLDDLHAKDIWAIARVAVFKDASARETHPEWYLTRHSSKAVPDGCANKHNLVVKNPRESGATPSVLWKDDHGGYWLDPASRGARDYIATFAKQMIDLGFDELQFDYVRFPSDGDVLQAVYPSWDGKTPKHEILKSFFTFLHGELKTYKPDIILSADFFGHVAAQGEDKSIGQRVADIGDTFDYVSFMVYPSHYYRGLALPEDPAHGFAAVQYGVAGARTHPDVVVERSLQAARDFLDGRVATSTSTATSSVASQSRARIRPWLEDFFHEDDRAAGRPWGAEKVRMQIDAAERVEKHGWMLWNAANIYTEDALKMK